LAAAARLARRIGVRHVVLPTRELDDPRYRANPPERCYHCKSELYGRLAALARAEGVEAVANGTNVDDLADWRPGLRAAEEFRVVSPLRDAALGKAAVRALARALGLPVWDKPASPCLASRIPYGSAVTPEKLAAIEHAEAWLRAQGFFDLRVRHLGATARVEVPPECLERLRQALSGAGADALRRFGFERVETGELRSGVFNAGLAPPR
jgi:uncharacterized protein